MAGSFDNECLRVAKFLRKKMEAMHVWHFGFHQAVSMAIGLVHLGKGRFSFKKT